MNEHPITVLKMKRKCFRAYDKNKTFFPVINLHEETRDIGYGLAKQTYKIHGFLAHSHGIPTYHNEYLDFRMINGSGAYADASANHGETKATAHIDNQNY